MKASRQMKMRRGEFYIVVGHHVDGDFSYATCAVFPNVRNRVRGWKLDGHQGWRSKIHSATWIKMKVTTSGKVICTRSRGVILARDVKLTQAQLDKIAEREMAARDFEKYMETLNKDN